MNVKRLFYLFLLSFFCLISTAHAMGSRPSYSPDSVAPPGNLRVSGITESSLMFHWDKVLYPHINAPLTYDVHIESADGSQPSFVSHVESATSYGFEGLVPDTEYLVSVRVRSLFSRLDVQGVRSRYVLGPNSSWSPSVSVRTLVLPKASIESVGYRVGEADGHARVGITLDRAAAGPVRLWLTHRLGGAGETDFIYLKAPVHVPAGATRVEVPIFITDDALDEGDETFGLDLSVDPISAGVVSLGEDTSTSVTIDDDDTLNVSISAGGTASITEGEEVSFTLSATNVTGSDFSQTPVRIAITHVDGSVEERDIMVSPNHGAGTTVVRLFSVYALADKTEERGTLTATVMPSGRYTVASGAEASVAVEPTSLPVVSFGDGTPLEVLEGEALPSCDVVLYGASSGDSFGVEVRTETGSAASNDVSSDLIRATVSGAAPRASVALPAIVDDRYAEGEESFTLGLAIAPAYEGQLVLGSPATRRVTIFDNDMLEIAITPNARSFEELADEPGMTLRASTDNPVDLEIPCFVPYRIRFNDSLSPSLGLTTGDWISPWSQEPDGAGHYTSSFSIEESGYYWPKIGLSTEPMVYSIGVVPTAGYTVAEAPANSADITITPNPDITKVGIERPVYQVRRGADSLRVAVLLTKKTTERRRIRLRLQAIRPGVGGRWKPDFDLPSTAFEGFYIASAHVTPESPLRVEMEVRLPFQWETDWDKELFVALMDDGWAEYPPQYSIARVLVVD